MDVKTKFAYNPDYCIHPGEYLEEVLESRNIKKKEIAERLAVTDKTISLLINGKAYIDPELAIKLENVLGISANIWNGMSSDYRLFEAKAQEQKELTVGIEWLNKFPVKDLIKNGFLEASKNKEILLKKIYAFFGVSNQKSWEVHYGNVLKSVCCKKTVAFEEDRYHTIAWLRAGEKRAEDIQTAVYNKEKFRNALDEIRLLTTGRIEDTSKKMLELCAQSGVALTFVPEFDKTHIWGITRWLSPEKALIIMSLRGKHNDFFWFTFFHESGHVLLHGKKDIFIDRKETDISNEENEANIFAQDILIPRSEYNQFLATGYFDALSIKRFADKLKVHQAIVAGRLVHDGKISFVFASRFRDTFEFTAR
jgi:addiction module HigA family antidote